MISVIGSGAPVAEAPERRVETSRLLQRIYRDVGLAAVASELQLSIRALAPDIQAAIERGAPLLKAKSAELAA